MAETIYNRPYLPMGEQLPLPFYFRSTGTELVWADRKSPYNSQKGFCTGFVELIWGLRGTGEISLYGQNCQIKPNHVFYYLPGEDHAVRAVTGEWEYRWLAFDGPLAGAVMLSFRYPRLQRAAEYPAELFARLEKLTTAESDPAVSRRICGAIMDLIVAAGIPPEEDYLSGPVVRQCLTLIKTSLSDPALDVMMLSEELNIPRSTLSKQFVAKTGHSIGRYIRDQRLHLARHLLMSTTLPVGEVARRCGFSERCTFTRFIKRSTGFSPLALRNREAEQPVKED